MRYLGAFLGAPESVANEWVKRTTERIRSRADLWMERSRPGEGRCVALRNSILSLVWFLVDNQTPPHLEAMMTAWRSEAVSFVGTGARYAAPRNRGAIPLRTHDASVADPPCVLSDDSEGGDVCDVETGDGG